MTAGRPDGAVGRVDTPRDAARGNPLEALYNPRVAAANAAAVLAAETERSAVFRRRHPQTRTLRYGPSARSRFDLIAPERAPDGGGAPMFVFLHGGFWRARHKDDYSFVAEMPLAVGAIAVIMTYDLCPAVALGAIVAQVRRGLAVIAARAAAFGGDPRRVTVAGHSAGAQLIARATAADTAEGRSLAARLKRAVLISGIYDLAPIPALSFNSALGLDAREAERQSPLADPPDPCLPLTVAVGAGEPPVWIDQARRFTDRCRAGGATVSHLELGRLDHFAVIDRLADPASGFARAIAAEL